MPTCSACGFESYSGEGPCPLCGGSAGPVRGAVEPTVSLADAPTLEQEARCSRGAAVRAAGERIAGRYRIVNVLGRGGMGTVYRVVDEEDGREKALKLLHPHVLEGEGGLERFRREATLLSRIEHPSVPGVEAWGAAEGEAYTVSRIVEGGDLVAELRRRGSFPPQEAADLAARIADALGAAHEAGIVHRDVKPHNVMLEKDGGICLVDFGIARQVGLGARTITGTGVTLGTPEYMSPEQFESHRVDSRSDVYSLGVVLFELLTGCLPFRGDTPVAVARKHLSEPPPLVRSLAPSVPAWLDRIVQTCLEKDRARRFASARELAEALRRPHPAGAVHRRRLPTGDVAVEDEGEETDWALVLECPAEKTGWAAGMPLLFSGRPLRLADVIPALGKGERWTYRFTPWPEAEVLRGPVDYERDAAERAARAQDTVLARLKGLFPRG